MRSSPCRREVASKHKQTHIMKIEIKTETERQVLIQFEIAYLEENWNRFEEWEAEGRYAELAALEVGEKPSHSYYRELHAPSCFKVISKNTNTNTNTQ